MGIRTLAARRRWLAGVTALSSTACGPRHDFRSPAVEQGPPPFLGPPAAIADPKPPAARVAPAPPVGPPEPVVFFRTQDSDEWVRHELQLQRSYARVIAVYATPTPPTTVAVETLDLNAFPGSQNASERKVDIALRSLQEAADGAQGGDLVAVLPGHYRGFTIGAKSDAGDGRYIHFRALGKPGEVVIDGPSPTDAHWNVVFQAAHHIVFQGFNIAGSSPPGAKELSGTNAGILIDGRFVETSRLAHHIAILANFSHDHKKWGIHSVDSHTVLVQDNLFATSAMEHAAYFSDGSDDYVIRRNVFFGSSGSGLQINGDPKASLEKLAEHPALDLQPVQYTRAWALGALTAASERFGANAFPDGRGFNFIIESNVMNRNGRLGGAALNLAGVRESLIQNNLIYDNAASGIAEWDNGNPFDAALVSPGPQSPSDVTGADSLPLFGCFNNLIRNNTVIASTQGRPALLVGNGSWGTRAYNNVFLNDEVPSIELSPTAIWRFEASNNVLDRVTYEGAAERLKSLALALPDGSHSVTGISRRILAPSFIRPSDQPWVLLDGSWWYLNSQRPDYHPRASGVLLAGKAQARNSPKTDLDGRPRSSADIGAYVVPGK
jgi:hypothetical protein